MRRGKDVCGRNGSLDSFRVASRSAPRRIRLGLSGVARVTVEYLALRVQNVFNFVLAGIDNLS